MPKKPGKTPDHVVLGPKGRLQCMNCGGSHDPFAGGQGVEIGMLTAMTKAFATLHRNCKPAAGGERCAACREVGHNIEQHVALKVHRAVDWPDCGDDGLSSKAIWSHMMGGHSSRDYPCDPDDFGRCSRLLAAPWAAGWRERLPEMARYGAVWGRLAQRWADMEALFAEERPMGNAPKLYALMQELRGAR